MDNRREINISNILKRNLSMLEFDKNYDVLSILINTKGYKPKIESDNIQFLLKESTGLDWTLMGEFMNTTAYSLFTLNQVKRVIKKNAKISIPWEEFKFLLAWIPGYKDPDQTFPPRILGKAKLNDKDEVISFLLTDIYPTNAKGIKLVNNKYTYYGLKVCYSEQEAVENTPKVIMANYVKTHDVDEDGKITAKPITAKSRNDLSYEVKQIYNIEKNINLFGFFRDKKFGTGFSIWKRADGFRLKNIKWKRFEVYNNNDLVADIASAGVDKELRRITNDGILPPYAVGGAISYGKSNGWMPVYESITIIVDCRRMTIHTDMYPIGEEEYILLMGVWNVPQFMSYVFPIEIGESIFNEKEYKVSGMWRVKTYNSYVEYKK